MVNNIKRQRGMTGLGWLAVLFLIGFFSMLAFRLVPIYLENYSVKTIVKSFKEEPLITQQSKKNVHRMIMSRLITNGIRDIKKDKVKVDKKPGILNISIEYFVRKPIVGNIEIIVSFHEEVELVSN